MMKQVPVENFLGFTLSSSFGDTEICIKDPADEWFAESCRTVDPTGWR
jgi:hypothetical protein